ncbi:sarcosine oxidase subunit gamma [Salibaculum halophilum]|uniref:sarcosine oxidase subunit gamma n=1 Tax=Salibaculum halophilum TaxID=1914408 RepID=UPI000A10FE6E|nr:sarcosine oxidase subunit gamma [Salibaculum halophilum]
MANLVVLSPCDGLLPGTIGAVSITETTPGRITAILPFKGQDDAVSVALKSALGVGFPAPGRSQAVGDVRTLWVGRGEALLMGADCPDLPGAACVDQSDAWATVEITGTPVEEVLARLVPVDLRAATFDPGHTARTLLGHMTASVTRTGASAFEIMVFRSMAETLVENLAHAASAVAARS